VVADSSGRETLKTTVELCVEGVSPYKAFMESTGKMLDKYDIYTMAFSDNDVPEKPTAATKIELWYRYCLTRASVNVFNPGSAAFIKGRFEAAQTVRYEYIDSKNPESRGIFRECFAEEIGSKIKEIRNLDFVIARQEKYLTEILYMSPAGLHPAARKLMESFSYLKRGDSTGFTGRYREAVDLFIAETEKINLLEEYLFHVQKDFVTAGSIFNSAAVPFEEYRRNRSELWPALEKFLREEEEKQ
jgi:hypothetical protein